MSESLPYTPGSSTSKAAANSAARGANRTAYRIYLQIVDSGQEGMTRDELVECFQALGVEYSSVTARCTALTFSGLVTEGPDTRLTRSGNPAVVLRAVPGKDFTTSFRSPPRKKADPKCTPAEREFLDRSLGLISAIQAGFTPMEAKDTLWDCFQELKTSIGQYPVPTAGGFRDNLGGCAWCHAPKCGNGCVT
jgi:hypothetical protein